jgi:hypothetical protein
MTKQTYSRQVIDAHSELDIWAVPRDGMSLRERIRWLANRREQVRWEARELEAARDAHVPDFPPATWD